MDMKNKKIKESEIPKPLRERKVLFVCAYGQSRSRWFAEKFMSYGIMANWCGTQKESMIQINKQLIEWADEIVLLDKYIEKEQLIYESILESGKIVLRHYLDDEPQYFEEWLTKTGLKKRYLYEDYLEKSRNIKDISKPLSNNEYLTKNKGFLKSLGKK